MKKAESFCTACEWKGDGAGLATCPLCGAPIAALDVDENAPKNNEEYPAEAMKDVEPVDDIDAKNI